MQNDIFFKWPCFFFVFFHVFQFTFNEKKGGKGVLYFLMQRLRKRKKISPLSKAPMFWASFRYSVCFLVVVRLEIFLQF